jgi:urease accessory protein
VNDPAVPLPLCSSPAASALSALSALSVLSPTDPSSPTPPTAGAGWRARLDLGFERRGPRTVLAARRHVGPLVVQRPFYPEGEVCHVYVVHPPGGVVAGDRLHLDVHVGRGARALLTTPAAGKFYRSQGASAQVQQEFAVEGGMLEWLPQENILFPDASVRLRTRVRLRDGARFFGWEVGCLGLPAQAAGLGAGALRQGLELWQGDTLLLNERTHIDAASQAAGWGLRGYPALGTLLACPAGVPELLAARDAAARNCPQPSPGDPAPGAATLSCTLVEGVLVCRALACRADRVRQAFAGIWAQVRPLLLHRAATPPRVWAT